MRLQFIIKLKLKGQFLKSLSLGLIGILAIHCSHFDSEDKSKVINPTAMMQPPSESKPDYIKFSENPNIGTFSDKRYRRSTRKSLEDESEVHSQAGSLWNNDGQSAYLFTQNKQRKQGDLLNVKLEGAGRSQIETKVGVVKKLLARIEFINKQNQERMRALASEGGNANATANGKSVESTNSTLEKNSSLPNENNKIASSNNKFKPLPQTNIEEQQSATSDETPFNVDVVPTRVVERLADGNYRVKGAQGFMIGKREYKVIVTGFVRPEDFSEDTISSNKLFDPQWDVVSLRRVE